MHVFSCWKEFCPTGYHVDRQDAFVHMLDMEGIHDTNWRNHMVRSMHISMKVLLFSWTFD